MLILSRKESESVIIGDNIVVKVISIDKGSVKIGFEAPDGVLILREELKIAVQEQNKRAQSSIDEPELKELRDRIKR